MTLTIATELTKHLLLEKINEYPDKTQFELPVHYEGKSYNVRWFLDDKTDWCVEIGDCGA